MVVNTPNPLDENEKFTVYAKPVTRRASRSSRLGAELSLTGPLTNLTLCTPYTYTVRITSPKSYRNASVELKAQGASNLHPIRRMHLVAHKTWTGTFQLTYTDVVGLERGVDVGVLVVPPHRGYHVLINRVYHLTPVPGYDPTVPSGCSPTGPLFGS